MFSLSEIVDYECRASERYRRAMSVIVLGVRGGKRHFQKKAGDLVRSSDEVVGLDDAVVIVMGETSITGALRAVARFATRFENRKGAGLPCGAATFPNDARNARDLQGVALHRFKKARRQGGYAFVWEG